MLWALSEVCVIVGLKEKSTQNDKFCHYLLIVLFCSPQNFLPELHSNTTSKKKKKTEVNGDLFKNIKKLLKKYK